jgi:hypothetical protein
MQKPVPKPLAELFAEYSKTKMAIVGAGGIGSHFCRIVHKLIHHNQLSTIRYTDVDIYDFDTVSMSNLWHQDYIDRELAVPKSLIMNARYGFNPIFARFTLKHMQENPVRQYGLICVCADNAAVRNDIYEKVSKTEDTRFIDMRAEGDIVAVFTEKCSREEYMGSLGATPTSRVGASCQLPQDVANKKIQLGNLLVPVLGAQVLLHMMRNEPYPASLIRTVI